MGLNQIAVADAAADRMQGYITQGVSRASDPQQIDRFLVFTTGEADPALAFCISACCYCWFVAALDALGIAYTADSVDSVLAVHKAQIAALLFEPSASVTDFINQAGSRFTPVASISEDMTIPRGSILCYDWGGGERHAELYDHDLPGGDGDSFATLGPNTGNGQILNKVRTWEFVLGMWFPAA